MLTSKIHSLHTDINSYNFSALVLFPECEEIEEKTTKQNKTKHISKPHKTQQDFDLNFLFKNNIEHVGSIWNSWSVRLLKLNSISLHQAEFQKLKILWIRKKITFRNNLQVAIISPRVLRGKTYNYKNFFKRKGNKIHSRAYFFTVSYLRVRENTLWHLFKIRLFQLSRNFKDSIF